MDTFEDTFTFDIGSSHASDTFHSYAQSQIAAHLTSDDDFDASHDLQDLIDSVVYEDHTLASQASSFEGNASTAQEAIACAAQVPQQTEVHDIASTYVDDCTERPSVELERFSSDTHQRSSFEATWNHLRLSNPAGSTGFGVGVATRCSDSIIAPEQTMLPTYTYRRSISSLGACSDRSSGRDYLSMERPTVRSFYQALKV